MINRQPESMAMPRFLTDPNDRAGFGSRTGRARLLPSRSNQGLVARQEPRPSALNMFYFT